MKGEDSAASASSAGDAEDLYGDLDVPEADVQAQDLHSRLEEAQRRIRTLEGKAALVGTECVKLRAENEALRRNASALYRTAKREVGRKDAEIAALRETVRGLRSSGSGGGGGGGMPVAPSPPPPGGQHQQQHQHQQRQMGRNGIQGQHHHQHQYHQHQQYQQRPR